MCIFVGRGTRESHLKCACETCLLVILFSTGIENLVLRFCICQMILPHMVSQNLIAMLLEKGFFFIFIQSNMLLNIRNKM